MASSMLGILQTLHKQIGYDAMATKERWKLSKSLNEVQAVKSNCSTYG